MKNRSGHSKKNEDIKFTIGFPQKALLIPCLLYSHSALILKESDSLFYLTMLWHFLYREKSIFPGEKYRYFQ